MNEERFRQARERTETAGPQSRGIGTRGEKTLHAVLKRYFEPSESFHEVKVGGFVADIANEAGITEIQTRQFSRLRKKLECFLALTDVTIVYPVAAVKWLVWIDGQTGETTKKRKSPRRGQPWDILYELYQIKEFLCSSHLKLCVVLLEIEEYRSLNGWSTDKKRGSTRYDRIPVGVSEEIHVDGPSDYGRLMPPGLEAQFTSREFQKASGLSLSSSQTALNVLYSVGAVRRVGKRGNRYVYEKE